MKLLNLSLLIAFASLTACIDKNTESNEAHLKRRAHGWIADLKSAISDDGKDKAEIINKLEDHIRPNDAKRRLRAEWYYDHWTHKPQLPVFKVDTVTIVDNMAKVKYYYEWEKKGGSRKVQKESCAYVKMDGQWYRIFEMD